MIAWLDLRLAALGARLDRLSGPAYAGVAVGGALLLSLAFFSPKFQLWHLPGGQNFEVVRARSYLAQVEQPLRRDVEPAMQWRLLPPLVANGLGLRGWSALILPWLGVAALLGTCIFLLRREGLGRTAVLLATAGIATSSAVLVPTGWLGLNDAWVWAALAGTALGRGRIALVLLVLLAPWVDERFVIGLPLALAVRQHLRAGGARPGTVILTAALALLPYLALRLGLRGALGGDAAGGFMRDTLTGFATWMPFAPLGWWMAWRAGWIPLGAALAGAGRAGVALGLLALGTLGVMTVLAADLSRSAAILLPLVLLGCIRLAAADRVRGERRLAGVLALNLLLPAMHVVHVKTDLISPLPLELFRLWRQARGGGA